MVSAKPKVQNNKKDTYSHLLHVETIQPASWSGCTSQILQRKDDTDDLCDGVLGELDAGAEVETGALEEVGFSRSGWVDDFRVGEVICLWFFFGDDYKFGEDGWF